MGDEQRVSWQELLAQSRDDFEPDTDFTLAVTFGSVGLTRACLFNTRQNGGKPLQTMRVLVLARALFVAQQRDADIAS